MSKYVYPAIFTSEPDGGYSVYFPDLEGCYTCGDTLADALFMAEDALALILYGYEKDQRPIPQPSKMSGIKVTLMPDILEGCGMGRWSFSYP